MSSRDLWELSQFSRGFTGGTKVMPRLVRTTINQATAKFWQRFWIMNWFRKTRVALLGLYCWCKGSVSGFLGHTQYPGNISVLWERAREAERAASTFWKIYGTYVLGTQGIKKRCINQSVLSRLTRFIREHVL